MYEIVTD